MDQNKMDRISQLSRKQRTVGLSDAEKEEQLALRQEYLTAVRANLKATLDSTVLVDEQGNRRPLKRQ